MTAIRRVTLPDGRVALEVPADDAGEFYLEAAEGLLQHLEQAGLLTWRQITAAGTLARLYGLGGGRRPWCKGTGPGRSEDIEAAARLEFARLLEEVPLRCRGPLTTLAMGEWVTAYNPLALWREGLTALADHLRLAPEDEG
jgi:hypothetical protein